jgi:hypothetical protein
MTTPDGSLVDWAEIEEDFEESALLLGNGLSINVWPGFTYGRLFDHAKNGGLTDEDCALFDGTPNFERVLSDLSTAIRACEVVGMDAAPLYERYRSVQAALGHAVREVHLNRTWVPDETLEAIREELVRYEWIFTTSYDLLIYWAMGYGERFTPFIDHFRGGGRLTFDPERADVYEGQVPVYFLHGALHLVVSGSGVTWKRRRGLLSTLLDQFGEPIDGDPQARPLLVTEGSALDKLRAIESNAYLTHALERLQDCDLPMVVFGSSLSPQDDHLVDALNEHPDRPVAVSMRPGTRRELAPKQIDIFGRLETDDLIFYDATSHPLGSPELSAE